MACDVSPVAMFFTTTQFDTNTQKLFYHTGIMHVFPLLVLDHSESEFQTFSEFNIIGTHLSLSVLWTLLGTPGGLKWLTPWGNLMPDKELKQISKAIERVHCWFCKVKKNTLDHSIMSIGSNVGYNVLVEDWQMCRSLELWSTWKICSGFKAICSSQTFLGCLFGLSSLFWLSSWIVKFLGLLF